MTEGLLYPRLPPAVARNRFRELHALPVAVLASEARGHDPDAVFAALGGAQVNEQHLGDLRTAVLDAAGRAGYPEQRGTRESRARFDLECADVLRKQMHIVAAEAAAIEVWAFLGVMLLPDVCFWRFPRPPEDRVIGPDLTRHTLARLWWRADQLADLEPSAGLTALEIIPENVMNQIFERRAVGGNRELVRAVARVLISTQDEWPEIPRRRLVRDSVRRLRRLLAFTSPEALDEAALAAFVTQVFEDAASAFLAEPVSPTDPTEEQDDDALMDSLRPPPAVAPSRPRNGDGAPLELEFDNVPLGGIPAQIATLVNELGGVVDDDLATAFERRYGIHVPTDEQQLLRRFAWSAKGRRFVELDEDNNLWLPGSMAPAPVEQLGDWTISGIYERAAALLRAQPDRDPFELLVAEVYQSDHGRVPRLVMSLVGKIVARARRDLNGGHSTTRKRGR
jgi:hypothetical protein